MIVGAAATRYALHEALLTYHSTFFFDLIYNEDWKRGRSGELRLPEEDAASFDLFVHWIYRGSFNHVDFSLARRYDYLSVYALGEKWSIPRLQDSVCDEMRKMWLTHGLPESAFFRKLYQTTLPGCKLRQYFVKKFVFHALQKDRPANLDDTLEENGGLAIDVGKEMFKNLGITPGPDSDFPRPESLSLCIFHVHGPELGCRPPWTLQSDFIASP